MEIVSAREFRANQSAVLAKAKCGESVLLTSRLGMFKIMPVTEEDSLTTRLSESLGEVKKIMDGELPRRSVQDMLDEL